MGSKFLEDGEKGFIIHCLPNGFRFYAQGEQLKVTEFKKNVKGVIHECNSLLKMVDAISWKSEDAEPMFGKYHKTEEEKE